MSNLENTEATIVLDFLGRPQCKITNLAGNIGEEFIRLYRVKDATLEGNFERCPAVGLSISADSSNIILWISCNDKEFPLYKNDIAKFKFVDGNSINLTFNVGTTKIYKENRNVAILSPTQILQFLEYPLEEISLYNLKTKATALFRFSNTSTDMYRSYAEGQQLLQIMTNRILGLKQLLNKDDHRRL